LFEGQTNYSDVEFLVYLNFFLGQRMRTRIVGTVRQRHLLHRLLTLTLFGPFDPTAAAPPSFAAMQEDWGVESRETYDFLLAAYETYAVRAGPDAGSPPLGIEEYVDFVTFDGDEALIDLPSAEVRVVRRSRAFDARIVQADGRE